MLERKFENCSEDFAERIILKSYAIAQKQSWLAAFSSLFADFKPLNPYYLAPAIFALGLVVNLVLYPATDATEFMDGLYFYN